ncbi:MAG: penicillin-binding protein 2 [Paracoccaceae bacterium]|nr:penicillin-binding protein 2 [Paracoccaceae bacterium]
MRRPERDIALSRRKVSRRAMLIGAGQVGFAALLLGRMRFLQIEEASKYRLLAEENRINIRLIPPTRGRIFDRDGTPLATNEPSYRIVIVPEDAGDVAQTIERLSTIVELDADDLNRALAEIERSPPFLPVTLAERVSWDAVARVAANSVALPGISPDVGLSRRYPTQEDFAHVIGYVGPISAYDLERMEDPDQLLRIPRFQIGKVGVESKLEEVMRGSAGTKSVEVNAVGRVMRELDRQEGQSGGDLQLAVDHKLQSYVRKRLGQESASVVVMDCDTGDIRSIVSSPGFDPNLFVRGISSADYARLRDNDRRPLASKAVQDAYPPGSTFKMIASLAGLKSGIIDPTETVYCPGYLEISGRKFNCWKKTGHGSMDQTSALRESCDVYYYDLALKVGIENITEMARLLGLGKRHDIPMSAISEGLTPTKQWKEIYHGAEWVIGDSANAVIGQGYVLASPLQLAVMTARLATGRSVTPRLVKRIGDQEQPTGAGTSLGLSEDHLRQVRRGMFAVSNHRKGTAYKSRIEDEKNRMAGKTGTAQVRSALVDNDEVPWDQRDHALFVCYAPYENPKYAISVVVEHGGSGSSSAAPIARDVMLQALFDGPPPLEAYPEADREHIRELQELIKEDRPLPGDGERGQA